MLVLCAPTATFRYVPLGKRYGFPFTKAAHCGSCVDAFRLEVGASCTPIVEARTIEFFKGEERFRLSALALLP